MGDARIHPKAVEGAAQRGPAVTARVNPVAAAARPVPASRGLHQRLGNRGTQAVAARALTRSGSPGPLPASGAVAGQLSISEPGDASEREADRMAAAVMRMPELTAPSSINAALVGDKRAPVVQRRCTQCEEENNVAKVQGKELPANSPQVLPLVPASVGALKGGGSPLPAGTRAFFEPRFGADFSGVRVHADSQAAKTAGAINAKAFTVGRHIAFGAGHFSPDSQAGRHLLAHELSHVVQQTVTNPAAPGTIARQQQAPPDDAGEAYAGADEIKTRLADIDSRLAKLTKEYAEAYSKQDVSMSALIALKKRVAAVRRERFIVETIEWNSSHRLMDAQQVDAYLAQVEPAAATEDESLALLSRMVLANPSGLDLAQSLLLNRPELFPEHVIGLYKDAVQDLQNRSDQHNKDFESRVAAMTSAPTDWLVKAFIYILKHESELQELTSRINFHVALDPLKPVLLERKESNSTRFAIDDLKGRVQDTVHKAHPPEIEEGLGFLYPALEASYFADLYGNLASQMELFRISVEATYERLNIQSEPDVGADLQRAYSSGIRIAVGPGYIDFHSNVATAAGGYARAHDAIQRRLDQWVMGLSDVGKIVEGFGIYDLASDIKSNLKALFTLEALRNLLIFFAVIAAIQLIPFGNVIADLILYGLFGVALLKMIVIFGSYFAAASEARNFMQLYRAAMQLQEAGAAVVDVAVQLATFGIGKAIGRFLKARGRKFKSAEDLKNDPIIKEMSVEDQAEFHKILGESKVFRSWKERLNAETRRMLDANPELERVYAEMDGTVRDLLTLCTSSCVPEAATAPQAARIEALLSKLQVVEGSEAFQYLREYLHNPKNRANLDPVIKELEQLNSRADLQARIEKAIQESAQAKGLQAVRRPDGKWEVTLKDGSKVTEYGIQSHDSAPGTDGFFQSHHGIQGLWGRLRVKGYIYEEAPTILLRNSRMNTPHRIVSSLQKAREGGIGSRTYAEERVLLQSDMKAAGVPDADAAALVSACDGYFAKLYSKQPAATRAAIFGDWKP
jgi:hypothetical protein